MFLHLLPDSAVHTDFPHPHLVSSHSRPCGTDNNSSIDRTAAPHFGSKFRAETVRKGQEAVVKCEAEGDAPISVSWFKDKIPLSVRDEPRYQVTESPSRKGVSSLILIKESDRRDSALFTCRASNSFGDDDTNVQLILQGESLGLPRTRGSRRAVLLRGFAAQLMNTDSWIPSDCCVSLSRLLTRAPASAPDL